MKIFKYLFCWFFISTFSANIIAQDSVQVFSNDSITLAQAYINLSLTNTYFDSLSSRRISKILPFEDNELNSIKDQEFISQNATLYHVTNSLLYLNTTQFLFKTAEDQDRNTLIEWKNTLEKAINHFNKAEIDSYYTVEKSPNSFFELIKFDGNACYSLKRHISSLKYKFTPVFNEDIYPDFKRIFNKAKELRQYDFDSLISYASLYNFPLKMSILNNDMAVFEPSDTGDNLFVNDAYRLDLKLDLISRYLQFKYLATESNPSIENRLDLQTLYESYDAFINSLKRNEFYKKDPFFAKEINKKTCKLLYAQLKKKFPYKFEEFVHTAVLNSQGPYSPDKIKYFFPNPAPLPSASLTISNYKPDFNTLGQVDTYLSAVFNRAGYNNQLHYYYDLDGFAITTSLEKFNTDGEPIEDDKRFLKSFADDGKFSFFEIFKSIFFETESEFRLFAFIVASKNVTFSSTALSAGEAQELLKNSHPSLPDDLKEKELPNKNLTILVYHFHQNDIGEVPMLDLNSDITIEQHFKHNRLKAILRQ